MFTNGINVPAFLFAVPGDSTGLWPESLGWLWDWDSYGKCLEPEVGTGIGGELILLLQTDNTHQQHK